MTTKRRRRNITRRDFDESDLRNVCLTGMAYFLGRRPGDRPSLEELSTYWREHRQELIDEWKKTHGPGSRPFGQWLLEIVPEHGERPVVDPPEDFEREGFELCGILQTADSMGLQEFEHEFLYARGVIGADEYAAARELWIDEYEDDDEIA
jgi:hypothetical protein